MCYGLGQINQPISELFFGKLRYTFTRNFYQITACRSYFETSFHLLVKWRLLLWGRGRMLLIGASHPSLVLPMLCLPLTCLSSIMLPVYWWHPFWGPSVPKYLGSLLKGTGPGGSELCRGPHQAALSSHPLLESYSKQVTWWESFPGVPLCS